MSAEKIDELVEGIASIAQRRGWQVAVAESLTSGLLAARLGGGPEASSWFRGAVVAYAERVKFDVLGVEQGPVVTEVCARQMAQGVAALLDADAALAATGVGGPDDEEGKPPGTVYIAVAIQGRTSCVLVELPGGPQEVLFGTVDRAITMLARTWSGRRPDDAPVARHR